LENLSRWAKSVDGTAYYKIFVGEQERLWAVQFEGWHGRPRRETTRKLRVPYQYQ
jgi:hypothetical protein